MRAAALSIIALARFIQRRSPQHRFTMLRAKLPVATDRIPRMNRDDEVTVPMPIIP